ncbi:MAG: IPT/TIG domain-containing protein [Planctomycetes bacterium]|nr:IPT/TIG domain-containing protein [Planctomycetota bacterium]
MFVRTGKRCAIALLIAIMIGVGSAGARAATTNWTSGGGDGMWGNPSNWDAGVPGAGDDAIIDGGTYSPPDPTFNVAPSTIASLNVLGGATLDLSANNLSVTGGVRIDFGATVLIGSGGSLTVGGVCTWDDGSSLGMISMAPGSTLALNGIAAQTLPGATYAHVDSLGNDVTLAAAATLDSLTVLSGNFDTGGFPLAILGATTISAGANLDVTGGGSLTVGGACNWGGSNGTLTMFGGTGLTLNGVAPQGLPDNSVPYYDVFISNANVTLTGTMTIAGGLFLQGTSTLDTGAFPQGVQGDVSIDPGSVLTIPPAALLIISGNCFWNTGGIDLVMGAGSTLTLNGSPKSLPGGTYETVVVDGTDVSAAGNMTVANLFVQLGGMFNTSSMTVTVPGDVTVNSGCSLTISFGGFTLVVGGACNWGSGFGDLFMDPGTLLELNGTAPQTLPGGTYEDVTLSGSNLVTLGGDVTVSNFTVSGTVSAETGANSLVVLSSLLVDAAAGFQISSGGFVELAGTGSWGSGSELGTFSGDPGSVLLLNGGGPQSLPDGVYGTVQINSPVSAAGNSSVSALDILSSGSFTTQANMIGADDVLLDPAAMLTISAGGQISVSGTAGWGSGFGSLVMDAGSGLGMNGSSPQSLPGGTYDNISIANPAGVAIADDVFATNLNLDSSGLLDTNFFAISLTGCIQVPAADSGTLLARVPSISPPPPSDSPAVSAVDFLLDSGSTLTLDGDGRVALQQCTIAAGALVQASQGSPGVEDGFLDVSGNWTNGGGSYDPGAEGVVVMGGSSPAVISGAPTTFGDLELGKSPTASVDLQTDATITVRLGINAATIFNASAGTLTAMGPGATPVELEDTTGGSITFQGLTIAGNTLLLGTGATQWHVASSLTVVGSAVFDLDAGNTLILDGTLGSVSVAGTVLINGSLIDHSAGVSFDVVPGGTLDLGTGSIQLNGSKVLSIIGGTLEASNGFVTVNNPAAGVDVTAGGFLNAAPGTTPVFQSGFPGSIPLNFTVTGAGTCLDLQAGTFDGLGMPGLYIDEFVTINSLSGVTFLNSTAGGRHITIYRNESSAVTLTWSGLVMDDSFGPGSGYNIEAFNLGAGLVTIDASGASGAGAGEADDLESSASIQIIWAPLGSGPVIGHLFPDFGLTGGGDTVEIEGANFDSGATVTIGGSPASATFLSPSLLSCVTPGGSAGATSLVVTNTDFQTDATVFFYSTPVSHADSVSGGISVSDYQMLSIPGFITTGDALAALESAFGAYDPSQWRAFHFLTETGSYLELTPTALEHEDDSFTGASVWLLSRSGGTLSFNTLSTAAAADVEVVYHPGWNQIGNPYSATVSWGAVHVQDLDPATGDPVGAPAPATSSALISNTLYFWNGSSYVSSSSLEPGAGYWIFVQAGHDILFIYDNPGGATKPLLGPLPGPLAAGAPVPPPPPGAGIVSASGGGGSIGVSGGSPEAGVSSSGAAGGGSGSSGGGGGGGGGGCWVESLGTARTVPMLILAMGLVVAAAFRRCSAQRRSSV